MILLDEYDKTPVKVKKAITRWITMGLPSSPTSWHQIMHQRSVSWPTPSHWKDLSRVMRRAGRRYYKQAQRM